MSSGEVAPVRSLKERMANVERNMMIQSIIGNAFCVSASAKELQISRATIYRKLGEGGVAELKVMKEAALREAATMSGGDAFEVGMVAH